MHPNIFYAIELGKGIHDNWYMQGWALLAADSSADLKANCQGTGFVVNVGADHRIIMELSAPVWGGNRSSIYTTVLVQKVEECYHGHVQLMIFIDCLVLLMYLSKWGQSDFLPDPGDMVHFDVIFLLIKKIQDWLQKVTLIKVNRHSGCFLIEMAD